MGNVYHYDCGLQFHTDGRPASKSRSGILHNTSLNALYVLLLANFGSFCMSLLTQPDMKQQLLGPIISDFLPLRSYCIAQVKMHWLFLQNLMNLTEEERSFFVVQIMMKFRQVSI